MTKKQIKNLIRETAKEIQKLEELQNEIYDELLENLEFSPQNLMEDDGLWSYCFNQNGKLDEVVKELLKLD